MISLRDMQRAFCSAVLSGDAACMTTLVCNNGVAAEQRMQIYSNSNRLGFLAAMQTTYPVIERLSGKPWFEQRVRQYQLQCPSRSGDLQYVGAHFAEFLQAELAETDYEYFTDVAKLEWAYQEVLIAADSAVLDPALLGTVAAVDYERLVLMPRTALRLVESAYPILAIWKANQPGADSSATNVDNNLDIRLDSGPSRVLVIRRDDHVELRELPQPSFDLLSQCLQGIALGAAVDAVAASHADFDFGACLRQLITLASLTDFQLQSIDSLCPHSSHVSGSHQ